MSLLSSGRGYFHQLAETSKLFLTEKMPAINQSSHFDAPQSLPTTTYITGFSFMILYFCGE